MRTLAVDVDGVIADLHAEWLKRYNADYWDTVTKDDLREWEMHKIVKSECGAKIYDYLTDSSIYDNVQKIHNSLVGVRVLRDKFKVIFVTACVIGSTDAKARWMQRHGFLSEGRSPGVFVACADKSLIRADILIDDRPVNLDNFKGRGILFSQPWNTKANGYRRLNSWNDLGRLLDEGL